MIHFPMQRVELKGKREQETKRNQVEGFCLVVRRLFLFSVPLRVWVCNCTTV